MYTTTYLVLSAENVGVVLLELPYTGQAAQGTRGLVTVQNTKVSNAHGQFTVTTITVAKQNKVSWAVHGLQSPVALLDVQFEHIIRIVLPVTRLLPDADVVHVRGLNLLVAALTVFGP
jgi:hypothetical protein